MLFDYVFKGLTEDGNRAIFTETKHPSGFAERLVRSDTVEYDEQMCYARYKEARDKRGYGFSGVSMYASEGSKDDLLEGFTAIRANKELRNVSFDVSNLD